MVSGKSFVAGNASGYGFAMPIENGKISRFFLLFGEILRPSPSKIPTVMARVCQITGKRPVSGNKVSHSNIKTKRRFLPNLQHKRFFLAEENKWISLKVSSEGLRTINKNGLLSVVKKLRAAGEKF